MPKTLIGLINQGNNCYLNAVLQSILSIFPLRENFRTLASEQLSTQYPFAHALKHVFDTSENSLKDIHLPQVFHRLVHSRFQPILQHDAHEFFVFLITQLSEELQGLNNRITDLQLTL